MIKGRKVESIRTLIIFKVHKSKLIKIKDKATKIVFKFLKIKTN